MSLRRARRSGDPIAAANLPALTRDWPFVSVMAGGGHGAGASRPSLNGCAAAPKRSGGCAALGPGLGPKITDRTGTPTAKGLCAQKDCPEREWTRAMPQKEMGAGIAASPHCAERRICRCSWPGQKPEGSDPLSILAHQLRRRFLSGSSLVRGAKPTYLTARPEGSLVIRSIRPAPNPDPKTAIWRQNHPMFHGPSWDNLYRVPLCSPKFRRTPGTASHDRKTVSSGASYRPTPKRTRKLFPLPAGGDRTFGHLPHRLAVAGFLERPGPPSRSPKHHARLARVCKSEKCGGKPVDNGDIGHNRRNLFKRRGIPRARLPFRPPPPTCPSA